MTSPIQSAPHEFKLFETGCRLCGSVYSMSDPNVCGPCFARVGCDRSALAREITRRKSLAPPAAEPMVEIAESESALPAGTRFLYRGDDEVYVFLERAVRRASDPAGGVWHGRHSRENAGLNATVIGRVVAADITLLAKDSPGSAVTPTTRYTCHRCGTGVSAIGLCCYCETLLETKCGTPKIDPYLEHNKRAARGFPYDLGQALSREGRQDALAASEHPLDRLAARRSRHKAEVLRDMSRDVRTWTNWKGERVSFWGKRGG